ncbi:hypothetical protein [Oceanicella sp. SM1341]|uniref:hypothetical protein n=1 Tax=Oceanicella sp. SM1341 TaxID=1548889 RepID=UPI001E4EBDF1|nr:hypothetical protein [Oceanicella sp. SM1341]
MSQCSITRENVIRRALPGLAAGLAGIWLAGAAAAADYKDPDWPCIQPKVGHISIGQMWAGPLPEGDWKADREVAALAHRLAQRRTSLEEAKALMSGFVEDGGAARRAQLLLAFEGAFELIDRERAALIGGIARYAHKQQALTGRIETKQQELHRLSGLPEAERDPDRIEELEDELAWDTRIYRDRAQSLTYVCETPVLLEKRAFALARSAQELVQ